MSQQLESVEQVLLQGYRQGLISRRRLLALSAKMPALAAAVAALGRPPGVGAKLQEGQAGGTLTMAYQEIVADTLNQKTSNFTTSRMLARHVLDNLVAVNPADGTIHPWLAESWEISPDGTEYTFHLKDGVMFHDATPFNAEAVKANFDANIPAKGFAYQAMGGDSYNRTEVIDELTAKVVFNEPHAAFLLYLSDGGTGIDSPTAMQQAGDSYGVDSLIGTGPFKFVEWVKTDHVTMEKNPDYNWSSAAFAHSGPAYLDELIFREVPEASVRAAAVVEGEVDMARVIEPNISELQGSSDVQIIATPKAGTCRMYLMNAAKAPTDDINVRKAVNMAVNKAAMLQLPAWAGYGRPGLAPLPSNMVPNGDLSSLAEFDIPYDPDGARALLEEAGWVLNGDLREKEGQQLVLDMVTTTNDVDAGQIEPLDGFLNEIGARLNIRAGDFNFWIDTVQATDFHVTLMSDSGYISVGLIEEFFRSGEPFANYGLNSPELDQYIDAAVAAPTLEEQWANLFPAMQIIMEQATGVMAWEQDYLDAAQNRVQGISHNEVGFPYFYGTWIQQ